MQLSIRDWMLLTAVAASLASLNHANNMCQDKQEELFRQMRKLEAVKAEIKLTYPRSAESFHRVKQEAEATQQILGDLVGHYEQMLADRAEWKEVAGQEEVVVDVLPKNPSTEDELLERSIQILVPSGASTYLLADVTSQRPGTLRDIEGYHQHRLGGGNHRLTLQLWHHRKQRSGKLKLWLDGKLLWSDSYDGIFPYVDPSIGVFVSGGRKLSKRTGVLIRINGHWAAGRTQRLSLWLGPPETDRWEFPALQEKPE